jgi:rubrerythrin
MKKLIKRVLKTYGDMNTNLGSDAAQNIIATAIIEKMKTEDKLEEEKARASWVCSICGKNTYDVDWDYIGSSTNHLGCELKLEMK